MGRLRELVPGERIVMTWNWVTSGGAYGPQESLLRIEMRSARPGGTELTLIHSGLNGFPGGIRVAWEQAMAKLASAPGRPALHQEGRQA